MTQTDIKQMASELVGDGQSPNKWFVTAGPYIAVEVDSSMRGEAHEHVLIEGYDKDKDTYTYGPFDTYKDAVECYNDQELDAGMGIGQAMIEDRLCGVVKEKWLIERKRTFVEYVEDETDNTKLFYDSNY